MRKINVLFLFSFFCSSLLFSQEFESVKWRYTYKGYTKITKEMEGVRPFEMVLDVSNQVSEFYSPVERKILSVRDSLSAKGAGLEEIQKTIRDLSLVRDYQYYTVYKNYPIIGEILFTDKILSDFYLYQETLNYPQWKIEAEEKELMGYSCQKATADFLGRRWIVWFAQDIPISDGPWKLGGLPGLILEAHDGDNDYFFKCIGIQEVKKGNLIKLPKRNYVKCIREEFLKDKLLLIRDANNYIVQKKAYKQGIKQVMPDGSIRELPILTPNYIER